MIGEVVVGIAAITFLVFGAETVTAKEEPPGLRKLPKSTAHTKGDLKTKASQCKRIRKAHCYKAGRQTRT